MARPASAPRTRDAAEDCPGSSHTVLEHVVRQSGEAALNAACNRDGWVRKSGTASPLTYFPCSRQRVVRCVTVCACFTYLLPLIGCLTPIVGYKASRKRSNRPISPYTPFPNHRMPPNTAPLSPSRSLLPDGFKASGAVRAPICEPSCGALHSQIPHPSSAHEAHILHRGSAASRSRRSWRRCRIESSWPHTRHTPYLAASASASSCWSALRSSLTRCLAESRVSSCAMPWSDTHPSSSSVKRGMASAILPCFSSRSAKL